MGGSCSTSKKRKRVSVSDKGLVRRIRGLQGEMMVEGEKQRRAYERKVQEKEAEWNKERSVLEEQVTKLRHLEVGADRKVFTGVSGRQEEDTAERWKKLYKVIKDELNDLIQRTQNSGSLMYDISMLQYLKREIRAKENTIEALKAKIFTMQKEVSKKAREVDILRQSLRIIMNSSKMSTAKSLSQLQDRIYSYSKSMGNITYATQTVKNRNKSMQVLSQENTN